MKKILVLFGLLSFLFGCAQEKPQPAGKSLKTNYKIAIVTDTVDTWSTKTQEGIKTQLDKLLGQKGAKAEYTVLDTQLKPETAADLVKQIKILGPDLIFTLNYPNSFADIHVSKNLPEPIFKIISMNPVPVEAGIIKSLQEPGGNITGVGIFLQMNSPIKLMKKINPKVKKVAFYSWDTMTLVNEMLEKEIRRACVEEGIELVEVFRTPNQESTLSFFSKYNELNKNNGEYFIMVGISSFVKQDGSPADLKEEVKWIAEHQISGVTYDEVAIEKGFPAGITTIWADIGAQLAEKGLLVLEGQNPGTLAWEYPRKYNVLFNKKTTDFQGLKIPENLMTAAYRVYTDTEGNYVGAR